HCANTWLMPRLPAVMRRARRFSSNEFTNCLLLPALINLCDRDDYLRASVPFFHVGDGIGDFRPRVASVDDRCYFPGFDHFAKKRQVVSTDIRNEKLEFLSPKRQTRDGLEQPGQDCPKFF